MKIKKQNHFQAEVSTSSLNDIMFFLLLFFLIISTVANPNVIKVLLPKSNSSQALSKQQVSLTVTEDKHFYINKKEVPHAQLEQSLVDACAGKEEPTVVIRMPHSLSVQDLVDVMQIGAKHKFKMVLATAKN
ncbi:MAG TPA: biopolymer transporter ExbD [Chryseolinea sp.]